MIHVHILDRLILESQLLKTSVGEMLGSGVRKCNISSLSAQSLFAQTVIKASIPWGLNCLQNFQGHKPSKECDH